MEPSLFNPNNKPNLSSNPNPKLDSRSPIPDTNAHLFEDVRPVLIVDNNAVDAMLDERNLNLTLTYKREEQNRNLNPNLRNMARGESEEEEEMRRLRLHLEGLLNQIRFQESTLLEMEEKTAAKGASPRGGQSKGRPSPIHTERGIHVGGQPQEHHPSSPPVTSPRSPPRWRPGPPSPGSALTLTLTHMAWETL